MKRNLCGFAAAVPFLLALAAAPPAFTQKQGGILTIGHFDSPASISLLEESTNAVNRPMMAVFNNLVMYDQNVPQNSPNSIVPDLATSWSWNEEGTELTLPLRQGVKWHDGKPFTANDVKCTLDLLTGKSAEKLRINPRKSWFDNLEKVSSNGDCEVSFHLKRAQPAFLASLATGSVNFPVGIYENPPEFVEGLAQTMLDNGIKPEIEVFDLSMLYNAANLVKKGLVKERPHVQFVMGVPNAMPARRSVFDFLRAEIEDVLPGATWVAAGIGRHQWEVNQWCLESGGHCRTGLEDNLRITPDRLAVSNAELVQKIVEACAQYDRRPASAAEARQMLGLAPVH